MKVLGGQILFATYLEGILELRWADISNNNLARIELLILGVQGREMDVQTLGYGRLLVYQLRQIIHFKTIGQIYPSPQLLKNRRQRSLQR